MKRSEYITGRKMNKAAFKVAKELGRCFVVTAYTIFRGDTFYADWCYVGPRKDYPGAQARRKGGGLYRVIVTPKRGKKND